MFVFRFNGHGRVDPDYADPFTIQRSTRESFNLTEMMADLEMVRDQIIKRYPDEDCLGQAVINHDQMEQSNMRLGIRLARSLLLGDSFTVYTTGSSNTAGHENMFMAAWPQQFQRSVFSERNVSGKCHDLSLELVSHVTTY